jgi:hypothetical protein
VSARALAAVALVALPAAAWVRETTPAGACLSWAERHAAFSLAPQMPSGLSAGDVEGALRAALSSWSAPGCAALSLEFAGVSSGPRTVGNDGNNLVLWRTRSCAGAAPADDPCQKTGTCGNAWDCWEHGDDALALTTTTFDNRTGALLDADIELNAAPHADGTAAYGFTVDPAFASRDVQTTLLHELGHAIGFDHSTIEASVMYPADSDGEIKRALSADDQAGVCAVYPRAAATPTCGSAPPPVVDPPPPPRGCQSSGGAGLLAAALVALRLGRRHRNSTFTIAGPGCAAG